MGLLIGPSALCSWWSLGQNGKKAYGPEGLRLPAFAAATVGCAPFARAQALGTTCTVRVRWSPAPQSHKPREARTALWPPFASTVCEARRLVT